jgi:hypothetical protein
VSELSRFEDALSRIELLLQENQKLLKQNVELLHKIHRQLEKQAPELAESKEQPSPEDEDREFYLGL